MKIHKTFCREELEKLPSDQLDRMLHEELDKETKDSELILDLMHILEGRETDVPKPNVDEAWQTFVERYNTEITPEPVQPKKRHYRWIGAVATVAAVFFVVVFGIPKAAGYSNIFKLIASWSDDYFVLSEPGKELEETEYVFKTDNPGLQQVYDAVAAQGITDPVVPMWIPEGYELSELKSVPFDDSMKIYARFVNGLNEVTLSYKMYYDHHSSKLPKNDDNAEQYEIDNVLYSVFTNESNATATWSMNTTVCILSVKAGEGVLIEMINSIVK